MMDDEPKGETAEVISLTIPHEERFVNVARIVVGGLAARLDVPYESMDDLQLAVETLLADRRYSVGADVTVEVVLHDRSMNLLIGPLDEEELLTDLAAASNGDGIGLGVLLPAVVDAVGFEDRPDGTRWLRLEKSVPRPVEL